MSEYKAELDEELLADWCAFCDEPLKFDKSHFSTILMGVFLEGLTPRVDTFLRRFSRPFPSALYNNLIRICGDGLAEHDILPWIRKDINQKLTLLDANYKTERRNIEHFLAVDAFTFTDDFSSLPDIAIASPIFEAIYLGESNYFIENCGNDAKMYALEEALYHIATNYALAHAIMSPLLQGRIELSNYLEVYLRGGDYVVADESIVVCQFKETQKPHNKVNSHG